MTHEQIKAILHDYFDEELSFEINTETQVHLSECTECSEYLNSLHELKKKTDNLPRSLNPVNDFWQSIFDSLSEIKEESIRQREETNQIQAIQEVIEDEEAKAKRKAKESAEKILKREQQKAAFREKLKLPRIKYALIGLAVLLCIFLVYYFLFASSQPWKIGKLGIANNTAAQEIGTLSEDEVLETDKVSRFRVTIPQFGSVTMDISSKIKRIKTDKISLINGSLSVRRNESEGSLIVETLGAEVTNSIKNGDYNISIADDLQSSIVAVNNGWITVKRDNLESLVLANHSCKLFNNLSIGLPYLNNSSAEFINAIEAYCFEDPGNEEKLIKILTTANSKNLVTIWNLMSRVTRKQRDMVIYTILGLLGTTPEGIDKDVLKNLDKDMMQKLLEEIEIKI